MKFLATFVLIWVTLTTHGQYNIDFENAPKNTIPFQYHKSHFNVKGPIKIYHIGMTTYTFNEDGFLIKSSNIYMTNTIMYNNNTPINITTKLGSESKDTLILDNKNRLIQKGIGYGIEKYIYDVKGNFKETHDRTMTIKSTSDRYTYDTENRLIKQEYFSKPDVLKFTRDITYTKEKDLLKVTTKHTDASNAEKNKTFVNYYKKGYLFDPNKPGDLKFDTYGNITEYQPHLNKEYKPTYVYF